MPEKHPAPSKNPAAAAAARRAREIVASLRAGDPTDVFDTFWQLDALPVDDVREAFAAWVGPLPDPDRLDAATRLAHGLPPRPLRLRTLSVAKDADVLDLGPLAEEQLRLAGKSWDGADLAPEERLDGEIEGSFAGTLERRVLAPADADTPIFDVLLFAEGSGVVFAAGTTNVVAMIAYRKVEMRDRRARVALEDALALPVSEMTAVEETTAKQTETTVKKTVTKKKVAKKIAVKKAVPKKNAVKATAAKKTTVKKAVAKKTTKKTVAKKVAPKKATAKKTVKKRR